MEILLNKLQKILAVYYLELIMYYVNTRTVGRQILFYIFHIIIIWLQQLFLLQNLDFLPKNQRHKTPKNTRKKSTMEKLYFKRRKTLKLVSTKTV